MNTAKITHAGASVWYDSTLLDPMEPRLFEPGFLRDSGRLTGSSQGRNQAFFLHHAGHDMVLRHFWRGGLVGRVNRDLYLRVPVGQSRAMQEFELLAWMGDKGLPVPRPVGARCQPAGLFYRADLLTLRIPDSQTLAETLCNTALPVAVWANVGRTIAQMHALGVHHADLNCRNILIDAAGKIWLIDFDKCERRKPGPWAAENLARLKRSFQKEASKVPGLHWGEAEWRALTSGYDKAAAP